MTCHAMDHQGKGYPNSKSVLWLMIQWRPGLSEAFPANRKLHQFHCRQPSAIFTNYRSLSSLPQVNDAGYGPSVGLVDDSSSPIIARKSLVIWCSMFASLLLPTRSRLEEKRGNLQLFLYRFERRVLSCFSTCSSCYYSHSASVAVYHSPPPLNATLTSLYGPAHSQSMEASRIIALEYANFLESHMLNHQLDNIVSVLL